jgi:hypothetical protein
MQVWRRFDPSGSGFIPRDQLVGFIQQLGAPFGWDTEDPDANKRYFQEDYIESLELSLYNDFKDF